MAGTSLPGQVVPQAVENRGIYDFLDELANKQVIEINSAIKPYSRLFIAQSLEEADGKRDRLNLRQQKELDFYMMDFGKELKAQTAFAKAMAVKGSDSAVVQWFKGKKDQKRFDVLYYKDSLFSLTVNPILGGEVFSNSSGRATYWRNGD